MEKDIEMISKRIFERAKYLECLLEHRKAILQAMFQRDLCAIWAILDKCDVPCKMRWWLVKLIMQYAEVPGGPQFW